MEKTIERYLVGEVRKRHGEAIKLPPLFVPGIPDRLVLMPGGVAVFVELKDRGKSPTPLQARVHDRLRSLGFRVEVLDSAFAVDNLVATL
jgi:hypothetical protein